jgi:nickel/cobalt exporter
MYESNFLSSSKIMIFLYIKQQGRRYSYNSTLTKLTVLYKLNIAGQRITYSNCQSKLLSFISVLAGLMSFGLLHGVNPSHGWPIAILYSMRSKKPFLSGIISSSIIAGAHFISSIVVVVAYMLLTTLIEIPQLYLRYGAAIGLGILAYIFWKEKGEDFIQTQHGHIHNYDYGNAGSVYQSNHEHTHWHKSIGYHSHIHIHQKRQSPSLKSITSFAFILGFAHEEEFVILAVAAGAGYDPVIWMVAYASSVAIALIGITLLSLKLYKYFQDKIMYYSKYLPKVTAILIAFMAVGFATGLF